MKFKTIKAFEEFFHFGQEDEFAPRERQDNDPATQEDEIINYGDVEEEDEIYGSEYNDPTEQELLPGDLPSDSDCDTCEHEEDNSDKRINNFDNFFMSSNHEEEEVEEEEEERENNWGDEGIRLERFSTFNEKKKPEFWKKKDKDSKEDKDSKKEDKDSKKEDKDSKKEDSKKEDKDSKKFVKPKKGEIPAALAAYQKNKKK